MPVSACVFGVESRFHGCHVQRVRNRNGKLERLACVAQIRQPHHTHPCIGDALLAHFVAHLGFQLLERLAHIFRTEIGGPAQYRTLLGVLDVGEQKSGGAEDTRHGRNQHPAHLQFARNRHRNHRAVAAKSDQAEVAWIATPVGGHGLDGARHGGHCNQVHAVRGLHQAQTQWLGNLVQDRVFRKLGVYAHLATHQVARVHVTQHDRRIGKSRLAATQSVTGRPRNRAGAARTDLDRLCGVDGDDAAAARADLGHIDKRKLDRVTPALDEFGADVDTGSDLVFGGAGRLAVFYHRGLGGGAAHVERDHITQAGRAGDPGAGNDTGGRTGLDQKGRLFSRCRSRHGAAVGLHDVQWPIDSRSLELRGQGTDIVLHDGPDVGVDHRRAGTFVLANLGQDVG